MQLVPPERPDYKRPRFNPHLGEDGLDHHDIAAALHVQPKNVIEKLKRVSISSWKAMGWNIAVSTAKSGKVGRPKIVWHLNTAAAKVFVARWENDRGDGYLAFLLTCERIAVHDLPRYKARIEELLQENAELRARLPGPTEVKSLPKQSTVLWPVRYDVQISIVTGEEVRTPRYAQVPKDLLTREEQRTAKANHLGRQITGMSKELNRLQAEEEVESLPIGVRPSVARRLI